ncbi:hypothetical protein GCM10010346_19530 [Streptomyces chryseus]|uniref:Uncharacterized protein n=1 Tax=Streptomyces chryseus TaxID=68186 RepID=A0ABQ3DHU9_9ACTN|nr:hypothetical protein GCM10010346_19530 [Streptomyces chryseus]
MAGAIVLYVLIGTLDRPRALASRGRESGWNRRGFLIAATAAGIAATGAGALGRTLGSRRGQSAVASRAAVRLPRPASPAAPVPPGARLRVPGISAFTTPSEKFYRVDTRWIGVPLTTSCGRPV